MHRHLKSYLTEEPQNDECRQNLCGSAFRINHAAVRNCPVAVIACYGAIL